MEDGWKNRDGGLEKKKAGESKWLSSHASSTVWTGKPGVDETREVEGHSQNIGNATDNRLTANPTAGQLIIRRNHRGASSERHRVFSREPDPALTCGHAMWIPYFGPVDPTDRPWGRSSQLALVINWAHVSTRDHEYSASTGFAGPVRGWHTRYSPGSCSYRFCGTAAERIGCRRRGPSRHVSNLPPPPA